MIQHADMTYSEIVRHDHACENPSYFMCGRKNVSSLVEKAKQEADKVLNDFLLFYSGDFGIEIGVKEHDLCFSITATLTLNGKAVRTEDPCDLLFLELNNLVLDRMLKAGYVSFGKGEAI